MLEFCFNSRNRTMFVCLSFTIFLVFCLWYYTDSMATNSLSLFSWTDRINMAQETGSLKPLWGWPRVNMDNRESFALWKAIKLKPEYKIKKARHVRFGEPLRLYSIQNRSDIEVNKLSFNTPIFPKTNKFVDCRGLFLEIERLPNVNQSSITAAIKHRFQRTILMAKHSCKDFFLHSEYVTSPLTKEEASFPIAFSILIFKDAEQFEILLRSIYRPQNVYCIHIDKKSPDNFRQSVVNLITCFDNVFITSTSVNVEWGTFTVLEPEIVCLRELFKHRIRWKYFINLTGQEMPLRTNYELVRILKAFDGANNVEASELERWRILRSGPPPFGVKPIKGAAHVILSRAFVGFVLNNRTAIGLYKWSRRAPHASEVYFSTLNFNHKFAAPGSYSGSQRTDGNKHPFLARLKIWQNEGFCSGKFMKNICILSPGELPLMATREELFANKLYLDYHPEMLVCMPELIFNRTVDEYNGLLLFNDTYYKTRDFVKNKY